MTAGRLPALDVVRGAIMALMALDHTRLFFFGLTPDPTDLAATTPALFWTRWITHVCAPGFILLAGMGAALRGRSVPRPALARYLAVRGALLVGLEVTLVNLAWIPDPTQGLVLLQVIWAIGWSMILLAALIACGLPARAIGALGLLGMAGHPALATLATPGLPGWLHVLVFTGGARLDTGAGLEAIVSYAVLPWAAVMAAGYGLGAAVAAGRLGGRGFLALGLAAAALFLAARAATGPAEGLLTFVNLEKYPPAPLFLAMTLAPLLVALALLWRTGGGRAGAALAAFGRAPLFFYVAHLYLLRIAGLSAAAAVWGVGALGPPPAPSTPEWPLWAVWAIWPAALALLWGPTRWAARRRDRSRLGAYT